MNWFDCGIQCRQVADGAWVRVHDIKRHRDMWFRAEDVRLLGFSGGHPFAKHVHVTTRRGAKPMAYVNEKHDDPPL